MRISDWSSDVCSSDLDFGDDDRQRDRPVDRALQRKAETPEHHGGDRAEREAGDRRERRDGERVEQSLDKLVIAERLFIISGGEARSEERRVGKACFRTCSSRGSPYNKKKKKKK